MEPAAGFASDALPEEALGVFFCVRVLLGTSAKPSELDERAWRFVPTAGAEELLSDELEILRRVRCPRGTPREMPDDIAPTLYELWEGVQRQVLDEYEERLDPARASTRIPSSQSWAINLLASEGPRMAQEGVRASSLRDAASALSVPRGPLVLRRLSACRRELKEGDLTEAAAVLGVLRVIEDEGLRPVDEDERPEAPRLAPERVRLVCYQVLHR